mmetsp:Transcript_29773/g.74915  ORF Transcript_29773/g.74915 Transcript_29773/m.74915 type:complete len:202 (-) Transcript_29773:764-1369(-)
MAESEGGEGGPRRREGDSVLSPLSSHAHHPSISSSLSSRVSSVPYATSTASEPRTRLAGSASVILRKVPFAPVEGGTRERGMRCRASHSLRPNAFLSLIATSSSVVAAQPAGSSNLNSQSAHPSQTGEVQFGTGGVRLFTSPTRRVTYGFTCCFTSPPTYMLFSLRALTTRAVSTGVGNTAGRRIGRAGPRIGALNGSSNS